MLAIAPITSTALLLLFQLPPLPRWEAQEIDPHIGNVCYALTTADVNADGKPDVVAVSEDAVVWYENPTWIKHDILRGQTTRDNVCLAARDIDGDGRVDFAVGAGWRPPDTATPGTLQWIGRDQDGNWILHPVAYEEPSVHRMLWADIDGDGITELIVVPLQGRDTKGPNWGQGNGVKIRAFSIPKHDPTSPEWPSTIADDSLHTIHNFQPVQLDDDPAEELIVAAWEGVFSLDRAADGSWTKIKLGNGYQGTDKPNRGASEIKLGHIGDHGLDTIATIEPWHGDQVVVYMRENKKEWVRYVVASGVNWGHAVWFADLDGRPGDELIVGQRDPRTDDQAPKGPGLRVFGFVTIVTDGSLVSLQPQQFIDDGGMACEDAQAADLDGDGRPDLIAGGRATHNVKIYWNRKPE